MNKKVSLWKLFFIFLKIGTFTIGGGLAMIPIIQNEIVVKQKWADEKEIVDLIAISQSLPGVIAVNTSVYMGYKIAGFFGAFICIVGAVLPSYIIILIIAFFMNNIADMVYVQKAFAGVKVGVTAMIAVATYKLAGSAINNIAGAVIAVVAFVLLSFVNVDIAIVVVFSALAGLLIKLYKNKKSQKELK